MIDKWKIPADRDAQIGILKNDVKLLAQNGIYYRSLITELTDAWIRREYPYTERGEDSPLLKRAREAVK